MKNLDRPEKLLDQMVLPSGMRDLGNDDLKQVADEVREELIDVVSKTGGHLGAGLGVVDLTVALHHIFNTPDDRIIWDVGHQAYPHKLLTGRRDRMNTLRQPGGLYGFTKRSESVYDPFGAGHSSTSISAGLGMAAARDHLGKDNHVIAVIGDGALSAGMAYEAMNNAGDLNSKLIVILNDNDMAIAPSTGAMSAYLSRLVSSKSYQSLRSIGRHLAKKFPRPFENAIRRVEEYARGLFTGGTLFEEMGFFYVGPVDGHNLDHLLPVLKNLRDTEYHGPVLLHVVTQKGKGCQMTEGASDRGHAVSKFDPKTLSPVKSLEKKPPSYSKVFGVSLVEAAERDQKIVAITAAMPSGTGLDAFAERHPKRFYDVGIAEQHAVTFAAGLATEGMKPFVAIYSTFLQRAYDQVVHDVALQNLPVRFAIDRAGFVGADGATHAGSFDITYLATLPNMVVMAAANESELVHMVATAAAYDTGPIAFRFPRGEGVGVALPESGDVLEIGKGRIIRSGRRVAILSLGTRLEEALKAADLVSEQGLDVTVADARFAKPFDQDLVRELAQNHDLLITLEEGSVGGFGSHVGQFLAMEGLLDGHLKFRPLCMPDVYAAHDNPDVQYKNAGLDADKLMQLIAELDSNLGRADVIAFPKTAGIGGRT